MTLGEKINNLRKRETLSQEQLALQLNVTRQTISNWESNITSPNVDQLKQLSLIFHISIDDLLENDNHSILMNKMSNTEKLAGMIIKGIKFLGIFIAILFILNILAFVLFSNQKIDIKTDHVEQQIYK